MSNTLTPDSIQIKLHSKFFPDQSIDEVLIRHLLKMYPEKFKKLLVLNGGMSGSGVLDVGFDGDDYRICHRATTEPDHSADYVDVWFTPEHMAQAKANLLESIIKADVMDKPHLQESKPKKSRGRLL